MTKAKSAFDEAWGWGVTVLNAASLIGQMLNIIKIVLMLYYNEPFSGAMAVRFAGLYAPFLGGIIGWLP